MADPIGYRREQPGTQPPYLHPDYRSTVKRSPTRPAVRVPHTLSEMTGPLLTAARVGPIDADLTRQAKAVPLGERIIVAGRVMDEDGKAVPDTLVELWQCNAAGRYHHPSDQHDAPLDPNFTGRGHAVTDRNGDYSFVTIKPGAYPWPNHVNAWRPAHIHFSLFGPSFVTRLVTQMFFPGDPLLPLDPIFNGVPAPARDLLVSGLDMDLTRPDVALGYRFDIVLRGRAATPTGV
jgi:protocatechuate 3,4-dioxygenase beta subunit